MVLQLEEQVAEIPEAQVRTDAAAVAAVVRKHLEA
jgi:hypothetical protein